MRQRIVCAAIRRNCGGILCSARHFDRLMREQIEASTLDWSEVEHGFIDQRGQFLSREAAYAVAFAAGQLQRVDEVGSARLYSEHLY